MAIAKGGKTLDCVEGFLDGYYNSFGFVEKSRVPWDDNLAPKDGIMKRMADEISFSSSFPETAPETQMTLERALRLLGVQVIPGGQKYSGIMIGGLQRLTEKYGEEWVIKHRKGLLKELHAVVDL
ncbi:MAG: hypothetical protein ABSF90_15585 [Syntrophobacteraceae bacterium]